MAGVYKRQSDKDRGKAGKWSYWFVGEDGKRKYKAGSADRGRTLELALNAEAEARRVREGIVEPGERVRREAALKPIADHVEDYRLSLIAKEDTAKHARDIASALLRLLSDAGVGSVADIAPDRVAAALGRLKARRSARTVNHAIGAVKAFASWLADANRIKEAPRGLARIKPYSEEADRRVVRRALSAVEIEKLLAATEAGPTVVASRDGRGGKVTASITGPERAALYRLAMGTGFRANELRQIAREQYALDGPAPAVTLLATQTKNGRGAVQPIARDLAALLRPFVEAAAPGRPVFAVPEKTAKMLAADLGAAGVPAETPEGVADFHSLRAAYITNLIMSGVDPKTVQELARHSTVTLTIGRYTKSGDSQKRDAVEGGRGGEISGDPTADAQR